MELFKTKNVILKFKVRDSNGFIDTNKMRVDLRVVYDLASLSVILKVNICFEELISEFSKIYIRAESLDYAFFINFLIR